MSQFFQIHPVTPQPRLVKRTVDILNNGGVVVYPTDSCYALGCHLGDKQAMDRIAEIRQVKKFKDFNFTLVCRDLSEIGTFAKVENWMFRLLKAHTPGPYTFILKATNEVPRRLQNPKRKTIGLRVPDNAVAQAILAELGEPMLSTSLLLAEDELPMTEPDAIRDRLEHAVDAVVDGGAGGLEPSTVVDLTGHAPAIVRQGKGDPSVFDLAEA